MLFARAAPSVHLTPCFLLPKTAFSGRAVIVPASLALDLLLISEIVPITVDGTAKVNPILKPFFTAGGSLTPVFMSFCKPFNPLLTRLVPLDAVIAPEPPAITPPASPADTNPAPIAATGRETPIILVDFVCF